MWLEYVQFSIGNMSSDECEELFERSLDEVGLHVMKGALVWDAYREFLNAILLTIQPAPGSVATTEVKAKVEAQRTKITALFRRQLRRPLMYMENTYAEYKEWLAGDDVEEEVEKDYKDSLSQLSNITQYEDKLISPDESSNISVYTHYIDYEVRGDSSSCVRIVCERAITEHPLHLAFWTDYIHYSRSHMEHSQTLSVVTRAVRNITWSVNLWIQYLQILETMGKTKQEISDALHSGVGCALGGGREYRRLWLSYCDYLLRSIDWTQPHDDQLHQLRTTLNQVITFLYKYFGGDGDPSCEVLQYWALIEACHVHNMEKTRLIWNDILAQGHDKYAYMWIEYAHMERAYGDSKHERRVYIRALNHEVDYPDTVATAWVMFERIKGNLQQYQDAVTKINDRLKKLQEKKEKELNQKKLQKEKKLQPEKRKPKEIDEPAPGGKKRKITLATGFAKPSVEDQTFKIPTNPSAPTPSTQTGDVGSGESHVMRHDASKDSVTVFISNLDYAAEEEDIKQLFTSCPGAVTALRLVKDFKGRSKGYGYMEFTTEAGKAAALKLDRTKLSGRPVYVSVCETDPSLKKSQFKYSTNIEKNKLFVKGLPLTYSKADVEKLFGAYDGLKEIRMVEYRNGHFKGIAYIEYKDELSAKAAMLKTDQMELNDKKIDVAISNPSQSRRPVPTDTPLKYSLGGGSKNTGLRGKAHTRMDVKPGGVSSMLPRAVQTPDKPPEKKSNADFRALLLGKK